jgi:hypothetical protein
MTDVFANPNRSIKEITARTAGRRYRIAQERAAARGTEPRRRR